MAVVTVVMAAGAVERLRDRVLVFGKEAVDFVHDFAREVADGKCSWLRFHVVEVRVSAVHLLDLLSVPERTDGRSGERQSS